MRGTHNGVVQKLKSKIPWLCDSQCFAHQLHLLCEKSYENFILSDEID